MRKIINILKRKKVRKPTSPKKKRRSNVEINKPIDHNKAYLRRRRNAIYLEKTSKSTTTTTTTTESAK